MPVPLLKWHSITMESKQVYPKRKPLRRKHRDYSSPGAYFITICTGGKRCFLSPTVGDVVCALKSLSARQAKGLIDDAPLWQRANYDHVVRDEKDDAEILAYMEHNPLRWSEDSLFAE